jgi:hypothetical protein
MVIYCKKREDGRYYVDGIINKREVRTSRLEDLHISFMIDTSQRVTTISEHDAINHQIPYKKFRIKQNAFSKSTKKINAYVIDECELSIPDQNSPNMYRETLKEILIPFENISDNKSEFDVSRVGLDFLEKFSIKFVTIDEYHKMVVLER